MFASPVGQKSGRHVWKFQSDVVVAGGLPCEGINTSMNGIEGHMLADNVSVCQHMLQYKTCRKSFVIASSYGS